MIIAVIVLIILGFCLWLLETYVPMSPPMVMVVRAVVVIFSVLYILNILGIVDIPITRVK